MNVISGVLYYVMNITDVLLSLRTNYPGQKCMNMLLIKE